MLRDTTVVHVRKGKYDVYIGRAFGRLSESKWHNPFSMAAFGPRKYVIILYEKYIRDNPRLMAALPELRGKVLGCWCKPQACHGDVLIKLLKERDALC